MNEAEIIDEIEERVGGRDFAGALDLLEAARRAGLAPEAVDRLNRYIEGTLRDYLKYEELTEGGPAEQAPPPRGGATDLRSN